MTATNTKFAASNWYQLYFKAWQVKACGSKPTETMLETAHAFGKPGKQSLALAMALRPEGATDAQIKAMVALLPPHKPCSQNNHRKGLIEAKLFNRIPAQSESGHTVYKIELSPKGEKAVANRAAAETKADEALTVSKPAKAASKPVRKPKAKQATVPAPTETPISGAAKRVPDAIELATGLGPVVSSADGTVSILK